MEDTIPYQMVVVFILAELFSIFQLHQQRKKLDLATEEGKRRDAALKKAMLFLWLSLPFMAAVMFFVVAPWIKQNH